MADHPDNVGADQLLMAQRMGNLHSGGGGGGDDESILGKSLGPKSKGNIAESLGQGDNFYAHTLSSLANSFQFLNIGSLAVFNYLSTGQSGSFAGMFDVTKMTMFSQRGRGH